MSPSADAFLVAVDRRATVQQKPLHFAVEGLFVCKKSATGCDQSSPMKYLRPIISVSLCLFISSYALASADDDKSVRILVAKADNKTAKVTIGSATYLAPLSFENSSFSWDDVKDGYSITPAFASLFAQGRVSIYIECSGAKFTALSAPAKTNK